MSAMSEIATELDVHWLEIEPGRCYLHTGAPWDIMPDQGVTVSLWHAGVKVLTGELHTAVDYVSKEMAR